MLETSNLTRKYTHVGSTNAIIILLMSAFFAKKIAFFGQNITFTESNIVSAVLELF